MKYFRTIPENLISYEMKYVQKEELVSFFESNPKFLTLSKRWDNKDWKTLCKKLDTLLDNNNDLYDLYEVFLPKTFYDWHKVRF